MVTDDTRRRFLAHFSGLGLGATLAPGVLWARMQDAGAERITLAMLTDALALSGITLDEEDRTAMLNNANDALDRLAELRGVPIPNDVSPPYHFSPVVPGMRVDRTRRPWVPAPYCLSRRGVLSVQKVRLLVPCGIGDSPPGFRRVGLRYMIDHRKL